MKTYRVAILGCRGRGTAASRAYHAHPRTEVVALCDLVQERLDTLGDELGVAARFTDLDEMIVQTQPDLVAIPTGTEFHYPLCMRVLEHGVHIEVEKPMCVDLEGTAAVMAKAKEKGVRVAVHHQGRVGALMRAMHKAFTKGAIGELRYINSRGKAYYGGLGLMNIGTHQLNNMLKFAGHCRTVSAVALTDGHPVTPEDVVPSPLGMGTIAGESITATLHFDNGVTANLLQHRFPASTNPVMEIVGTEGKLFGSACLLIKGGAWHLSQPVYIPDGKPDQWEPLEPIYPEHYDRSSADSSAFRPAQRDSDGSELAEPAKLDDYWFVDEYVSALDQDRDHECSGAEGHHIVGIMMGIFESAAYGKQIDLPQKCLEHPLLRWRREEGLAPPEPMPRDYNEWLAAEDQRLGRG